MYVGIAQSHFFLPLTAPKQIPGYAPVVNWVDLVVFDEAQQGFMGLCVNFV